MTLRPENSCSPMQTLHLTRRAGLLVAVAAGWHVLSGASGWGSAFELAFGELLTLVFGIAAAGALVLLTERPNSTAAAAGVIAVGVIGTLGSLFGLTRLLGGLLIVSTVLLGYLALLGWQLLQVARVGVSEKVAPSRRRG